MKVQFALINSIKKGYTWMQSELERESVDLLTSLPCSLIASMAVWLAQDILKGNHNNQEVR